MANGGHPLGIHAVPAPPSPSPSSSFPRHHPQLHLLHQHRLHQQQQQLFLQHTAGPGPGPGVGVGMDQAAVGAATSEGESMEGKSPECDRAESGREERGKAGGAGTGTGTGTGAGKTAAAAVVSGTGGRGKQKESFADWSSGAINSLLDAFTEKNEELNGRNLRGRDWEEVTSAVNARSDACKAAKSVLQCRNKLDNLKKRHKIEKDKMFTTGSLKTKWQWFAKMDAIVGRTAKQARPTPPSSALPMQQARPPPPHSSPPQATSALPAPSSASADPKKKPRKKMKLSTPLLPQPDPDPDPDADDEMEFLATAARAQPFNDFSTSVPQNVYSKVTEPTLAAAHLRDLPGFTRSVYEREYALIAPESQVYSALPGWINTLAAYLITPAMGSHFSMYLAQMKANSSSAPPLNDVERFIFVVKGEVQLSTSSTEGYNMHVDWFAYLPPNTQHSLKSTFSATIVVFERRYIKDVIETDAPELIVGVTDKQPVLETPGEVFALRKLLPTSSTYDFNIHVMDFQPGEFLNVKEVHYFQHGLLLLEGRGIYRLGEKWHPVQAGDVIWMAPFVPQWYAALGRTRSRYLLYKDVNRDPLLHPY